METSVALPLSVHVAVRELRALHGDVAPARPRQPRGRGYAEPAEPRLHLNPAFSEWLMGLPVGWTCLDGDVVDVAVHLRPHDRWASWRGGGGDAAGGGGGGGGWSAGSQVALGVARQMDRCRTVGNSVVPTCVAVAWRVLTGLRHAVNPRVEHAPPPVRSKHRLDPTRRVPVMIPDPRVRTEWGGDEMGKDGTREGGETGGWKPWSAPWPTFFAPVDSNSNPLEGRHNKRKRGAPGPTDESAPPETTERARGGSPSTSAREKLEPWGETRAGEARRASRRGEVPRGRSGSPGVRRPSAQGPTRSRSSQNRAVTARDARRDRINALTASPDVRNGASALLRQLWESMLGARAEYGRVAEALRSPATRNRGESARVDWTSPSPLPRLFRSPAEVRDRRDTTRSARVGVGRVHAESDGKIGTRENPRAEPKLRARVLWRLRRRDRLAAAAPVPSLAAGAAEGRPGGRRSRSARRFVFATGRTVRLCVLRRRRVDRRRARRNRGCG